MKLLMGIDLGSTSIKVIVFDANGNQVAIGRTPNKAISMDPAHPEWLFWDHHAIWHGVCEGIKTCVEQCQGKGEIAAVAVTGFGCDGIPIDEEGNELYPFISWSCKRTEKITKEWSQKIGLRRIFNITGKQVMAMDTLYRILWFRENFPEKYEKLYKWVLIEDYINYKLSGVLATDRSMASCTSMLDQSTEDWSDELLIECGLSRDILSEVKQSGTVLGSVKPEVARETGLSEDTLVVLGGHDYSCAAVSCGVLDEGKIFSVMGTWEMFFTVTDEKRALPEWFDNGFKYEAHAASGRKVVFADVICSFMVEWFKENILKKQLPPDTDVWKYVDEIISRTETGAKGIFFLPHLVGKGCPQIDDKSQGAFIGLGESADIPNMLRAIIEGLNYQFREIVLAYEKMQNSKIEKIVCTGGPSLNKFWMQNKADISGKEIEVAVIAEATALGAAIFAGIGAGVYADEADGFARTYREGVIYRPGEYSAKYVDYYDRFYSKIYDALKPLNSDIFDEFRAK